MNPSQSIFGKKKRRALTWFATSLFIISACTNSEQASNSNLTCKLQVIEGETQGTTYGIKIVDGPVQISKKEIDSILHDFDMSLSGYIAESTVSLFNEEKKELRIPNSDSYFIPCYTISKNIYQLSEGAFDPTVFPLMQLWGFLKDTEKIPSQFQIDSTLRFMGFNDHNLRLFSPGEVKRSDESGYIIQKTNPNLKLDFNAIAQGYSVDVLADYLRSKGSKNFYVEIGGEIYVEGKNPDSEAWKLGVDKPVASNNGKSQRVISAVISVSNKGIATSGNYRKFYEKDGKIYAHTLNPKTGRPAENEILSATVIAKNTAIADGIATAFMVMGLEKTKEFIQKKKMEDLEVLIIYTKGEKELQSWSSEGMKEYLK